MTILDLHRKKPTPTQFKFITGAKNIVFDQRSRLLAVTTGDAIRVIDLPTTQEIAEIPFEEQIGNLAFSYDGKYLAVSNHSVRIWNLSPEALLKEAKDRLSSANQP